ncbi:MAG TPA: hypothetical protein VGG51_04355 [Candidatus Cybelea sp.]|jgi:hypothetical protein
MRAGSRLFVIPVLAVLVASCSSQSAIDSSNGALPPTLRGNPAGHTGGLGKVLSSAYGGQILGFDIDQHGTDGLLSEARAQGSKLKSAIETFDLKSGKITKIVKTLNSSPNEDFETFGIVGDDVGFVDEQRVRLNNISRNDKFFLLNPVKGKKITGRWNPPRVQDSVLYQQAANQATSTQVSVVFRSAFSKDVPWLYVWDSATNEFLNAIHLKYTGEAIAEDTSADEAVLAGQSGSGAPINTLVNLKNKKITVFSGVDNGPYGAGAVNGLAVDSKTRLACTTTELNAQVEFYDLAKKTGFSVQLPDTGPGSQLNSGTAVTSDAENRLFLVAQPISSTSGGSSIYVYNEKGDLTESLGGFAFAGSSLPLPKIAVDPALRLGWVNGPTPNQLQQFSY